MTDEEIEAAVLAALDATGVAYEVLDCDPALADTAAFCAAYGVSPDESANTIVVASKAEPVRHAACVVLATTRLDVNGTVRKRLGARKASFADPSDTAARTGMVLGGVTPFGLPPDYPVWVDAGVLVPDTVIVGGGSRSKKIRVSPRVFSRLPNTEIVADLAKPAQVSVSPPK
ncbi:MAG TPA: YbaK/EbsC family protein [Acidimicrobiales bacterium]